MPQLVKCVAFLLCVAVVAMMIHPASAATSYQEEAPHELETRDSLGALASCDPVANCSANGQCNVDGTCNCNPNSYGPHCGFCNSTVLMTQVLTGTFYGPHGINYTTWSVTVTAGSLAYLTNVYLYASLFQFYNPIFAANGINPTDGTYLTFTLPAGDYIGGYIPSGHSFTFTYSIYGNSSATWTIGNNSCVPPVMPTAPPTIPPTRAPTTPPTIPPTIAPTRPPTVPPTASPAPTKAPTTPPTVPPTQAPTRPPTVPPTIAPTRAPTVPPTATPLPTRAPTTPPTVPPTVAPTRAPTSPPTAIPSPIPTQAPGCAPCPKKPTTLPLVPYVTGDNGCTGETPTQILTDLYNNLGGASWTRKTNWLSGSPCTWYGITCDGSNNVIGINLASNNLKGNQLPPSLGCLSTLTSIVLDSNSISGQLPNNLCKLTNLVTLTISYNNLGGVIPTCFANLVKLQEFWVQFNGLIGGLPSLVSYNALQDLRVNDNCLSGNIPQAIPSHSITNLDFGDNSFDGCIPDSPYQALGTNVNYAGNLFCLGALPCWLSPTTISCPFGAPARTNTAGSFIGCANTCQALFP